MLNYICLIIKPDIYNKACARGYIMARRAFMTEILALIPKARKYVTKATFRTIDNGECNKFICILFEIVKEIHARTVLNEINPNFAVNYDITAFNNYKKHIENYN